MYFNSAKNDDHPALHKMRRLPRPPETAEQIDAKKKARTLESRNERKAELEYEIICAKLDNELAALKKQGERLKDIPPEERLKRDSDEHDANIMGVHKIAKQKLDAYEKEFADDQELLEMARLSVKMWKAKYIP
jgi:hypothetical protein